MNVAERHLARLGSASKTFRQDINGLRALAVATVVLFHFRLGVFPGGFIGVDVFFVISGFLMTQIITSRLAAGRFSVAGFYFDRGRRIVPALLVMLLAVLLLGYLIAPPVDYRAIGKHASAALLFCSNMLFYHETGYFAPSSSENWLLHTWSLAVEWQFYLIYPILLIALHRLGGRAWLQGGVAIGAGLSLAWCMLLTPRDASAAFYLLPPRAWEMMAGGLISLFPLNVRRVGIQRGLEWGGLAVILTSAILFDGAADWPGWRAAIPTTATMAVLAANRGQSRLLSLPPIALLGRISYSVYLWHWPVAVLLLYVELSENCRWRLAGVAASLVLGWASYLLVERPTARFGRDLGRLASPQHPPLRDHAIIAMAIGALLGPSIVIWRADGLPSRVPDRVNRFAKSIPPNLKLRRDCFDEGDITHPCLLGGPASTVGAILIGDSHAMAVAAAVTRALHKVSGKRLFFRAYPGCAVVEHAGFFPRDGDRCLLYNETYLPVVESRFAGRPVIYANSVRGVFVQQRIGFVEYRGRMRTIVPFSPARYEARLTKTICAISAHHPTALMAIYPDWDYDVPARMTRRLMLDPRPIVLTQTLVQHRTRHKEELALLHRVAQRCGATVLDPAPLICRGGICASVENGRSLYYDGPHMNEFGAARLEPMFERYLAAVTTRQAGRPAGAPAAAPH